jgi:uncharacterized protein YkwD
VPCRIRPKVTPVIVMSYLMAYQSALSGMPSVLALLVICLAAFGVLAAQPDDHASPLGYARWAEQVLKDPPDGIRFADGLSRRVLEMTNERRGEAASPLRPLEEDPGLGRAARAHAVDLLQHDYLDHLDAHGRTASERVGILDRRFVGTVGENLAEHVGTQAEALPEQIGRLALSMMNGWMGSSGHRHNLLSPDYTHQGIGTALRGDRLVVVQVFGDRRAALEQPLPITVKAGHELPLMVSRESEGPAPEKYGFARPGQAAAEVVARDLSSKEVAVDPGTYRVEFFIPTGQSDTFAVADGPIVVVE